MQDLNDIVVFAAVVENNGFTAAGRALQRPKSSVSRHIDRLEARLGVRLLERSTRRVRLTEVGAEYYERCRSALAEIEDADRGVALHRAEPIGIVRVTCPTGIARYVMSRILPEFMARYPAVQVHLQASNEPADLLKDKIDVAIRARAQLQDEGVTMRRLGASRLIFVSRPEFSAMNASPTDPAAVSELPFLSFQEGTPRPTWIMRGPKGVSQRVTFRPVLWSSELDVLMAAACAGVGVALTPAEAAERLIADGRLVRLLPDWHSEDVTVHLVFPTGRGLRPAVRVLIDFIADQFERSDENRLLASVGEIGAR